MISTAFYRSAQCAGWVALLAAHGVVLGTAMSQAMGGPGPGVDAVPGAGAMLSLRNSLGIACGATIVALVIAIPAACVIAQSRRRFVRWGLTGLMLISILTMPSIHAYAWQLQLTCDVSVARWLNATLVAAGPWGARGMASIVLAMWLWPIPAAVIVDGLRRGGGELMELALLDAAPATALWRGAAPAIRGPVLAACVAVFVAAALDAVVAPLTLASDVWAVDMVREAELAMATPRPAGRLIWEAWPMLGAIALLALVATPGIRRIRSWHVVESMSRETRRLGGRSLSVAAVILAAFAAMTPIAVFLGMLATDSRYSIGGAMSSVWRSAKGPAEATAIVAMATFVLALAIAIACELGHRRDSSANFSRRLIVVMTIVAAALPASLVSTSLISFYASRAMGAASGWNVYDDTPIVWIAAMLARYAFIPVCLAIAAGWAAPSVVQDQADVDGATGVVAWRAARWPFVRGAAIVGALIAAVLAFSEVQASLLAKAPRWGDDSLAVYLDSQMHYGRHGQTLALALLMYIPVTVVCVVLAIRSRWRARVA